MTKICFKCKIEQPIDSFNKDKTRKGGFGNQCKKCLKIYKKTNRPIFSIKDKEYKKIRKDKISEVAREYYIVNKELILKQSKLYSGSPMGKAVRANAFHKRRGVIRHGHITSKQILELQQNATRCFWCEAPLHETGTHIDHFIPLSKGGEHELYNLVVSCPTCNLRKGAKDPLEFSKIIFKEETK